jgi:hypothetical protein
MTKKHLQEKVKQSRQFAKEIIEWNSDTEQAWLNSLDIEEPRKIDFTLMPVEFHDVVLILQQAHESGKYAKNGWQEGIKFDEESNNSSKQRHLDDLRQKKYIDKESGLDADLHLACRALMSYTLRKRGKLK